MKISVFSYYGGGVTYRENVARPIFHDTTPEFFTDTVKTWVARVGLRNTTISPDGRRFIFMQPGPWPYFTIFTIL